MNSNQTPPPGSVTLTPASMAFAAAMLVVGAVGGYFVGANQTPGVTAPPGDSTPVADTTTPTPKTGLQGNVINNTGGSIRRLSEEEKQELLAGRKPGGGQKAEPVAPKDSRFLTPTITASFEDAVLLAEYKRAVAHMSTGNARAARSSLTTLENQSENKSWAEPVAAMLADAKASVGEVQPARTAIAAFERTYPKSDYMALVMVAEGKSFMQEGKRARAPNQKRGDPVNDQQRALYAQAISIWDEAVEKYPADEALEDALLNKSALLLQMGDIKGAEGAAILLAGSFGSSKNAPRALSNVARAAIEAGEKDMGLALYQRLVDDFPRDRLARSARSQIQTLALMGEDAPSFDIEEWIGEDLGQIEDLKGKTVMLVFWATWCPHCRNEMPKMEELWNAHKDEDFILVAVTKNSKGQTTETVREYASANGLTMPIAIDSGLTSRNYGVSGIPAAALIDKTGKVVFRNHPSQLNDEFLAQYL
jgi:thiol-disulfide isomerase/thioredoxin